MPFGLRFGSSPLTITPSPVSLEITAPGFRDTVALPVPGTVVVHDYPAATGDYRLDLRFHVAEVVVHVYLEHLERDDGLFLLAEPNNPPGQAPGVRFVGTIWHATEEQEEEREHCTITCAADGKTADCCIMCANGSTIAKICC